MGFPRPDIIEKLIASKVRPVRKDGVFILEDDMVSETLTSCGIILLPKTDLGSTRKATVVSVGQSVKDLKPNDRVVYQKAYGNPIPHEDDMFCRLLYVTVNQIEGVIDGDESKVV